MEIKHKLCHAIYLFICVCFHISLHLCLYVSLSLIQQGGPGPPGAGEFERLLKESQKEVLRLQRQLSVSSARDRSSTGGAEKEREQNEAPVRAVSYFTAPPCGLSQHCFSPVEKTLLKSWKSVTVRY